MPVAQDLERARALYREGAWLAAYDALSAADAAAPLDREDLGLLAVACYMLGRDDEYPDHAPRIVSWAGKPRATASPRLSII